MRGIGPSLPIPGALADPTLQLYDGAGNLIAFNDDWATDENAQGTIASGIPPSHPQESALVRALEPNPFTAVLRGAGSTAGLGLVEVYDLESDAPAQIVNIATRGFVLTGDDIMIAGIIVTGNMPAQLVLRGIGPSLAGAGVPDVLADPRLDLVNENGQVIFANDNWQESQGDAIQNTGLAPTDPNESAILFSLPPGNYTALVSGVGGGIGNALVEVYKLAP